jgi:type IV secretion system protein VirB5
LYNGTQYTAHREWSPSNWEDVLKGLSGGNPARYQQLVSQYQHDNPTLSVSDFDKGESSDNGQIYQAQIQNNQAANVTATYAFNDIQNHIEHIEKISNQIESAPNEKAATDLNTRMNTEIAYTQVEVLKQLALMNEQTAQRNEDRIKYETANAKFDRLPDE